MSENILPLSIIEVTGEDRINFLQGQLTQDMNLTDGQWQYAAQCNPQGRVIAFFIVFSKDDSLFLLTDSESSDQSIEQLKKYVMRSKVSFEQCEESVCFVAIPDETEESESSEQDAEANEIKQLVVIQNDEIRLNHATGSYICSNTQPEDCIDSEQWRNLQIQAGIPILSKKALNKFTPEAINLDLLGAVSFNKGCYTGQEIVARMHYLGKAKKRLYSITIEGKLENIKVGDNITDSEGKTIGHLVDFVSSGEALISLKTITENLLHKNKQTIKSINGELLL